MQEEIGQILTGKVTGITKFGVFVDLENGQTGMVHISEVSDVFVKEISDFVKLNDTVTVKILSIGADKKISLSMKQANPDYGKPKPKKEFRPKRPVSESRPTENYVWTPKKEELSFEEMMSKFKQSSEEKMSDLKRVMDVKKNTRRGR